MCAKQSMPDISGQLDNLLAKSEDSAVEDNQGQGQTGSLDRTLVDLSVEVIHPNPQQVRLGTQEDSEIEELGKSMDEFGVLEPLIVERLDDGEYQVVCGHRRLAAAKKAGRRTVPCIVWQGKLTDTQRILMMLIENLQQKELSPLEEAEGYARLREMRLTREKIARLVGKSRTHVGKALSFRERLTGEERKELQKRATSPTLKFSRLDEATRIDDPELRQKALFTDMPIREIREQRKQSKSPVAARRSEKIIYAARVSKGELKAYLRIEGRQTEREAVFGLAHELAERLCEEHNL